MQQIPFHVPGDDALPLSATCELLTLCHEHRSSVNNHHCFLFRAQLPGFDSDESLKIAAWFKADAERTAAKIATIRGGAAAPAAT